MDLKQLEYFVRVAELGSFTKAALSRWMWPSPRCRARCGCWRSSCARTC